MMLDDAQREAYQRDGFLVLPGFVDAAWLERLRSVTAEFIEQSRALTESNRLFDLETDPDELRSVYEEIRYTGVRKDMEDRLAELRVRYAVPEDNG